MHCVELTPLVPLRNIAVRVLDRHESYGPWPIVLSLSEKILVNHCDKRNPGD